MWKDWNCVKFSTTLKKSMKPMPDVLFHILFT
uniref:Uncharacterized protein n=1 Tax=Anguilla anguilla TaxID=7936 RepID=A0A0E9QJJ0_ANGAN